ncbi:DNA helicase rad5 [Aspergillus nanangensis]|uniref:DNA helicase rad5 n=1 Tax=Aspergillus nanangensis TaxID=2582783 RepID=A0AAD4GWE8_ASPNN|nr:DNA helicase rad5 [Aspergillus nanangensis]
MALEDTKDSSSLSTKILPINMSQHSMTVFQIYGILLGLSIGTFLVSLDVSIVGTVIPAITSRFHSTTDIGWYAAVYPLAMCSLQPLSGKISVVFSPLGRAVAGAGGSGVVTGGLAVLAIVTPLEQRALLTGLAMALYSLGTVVAPLIGGALTQRLSWRWCFLINLPAGAVTIVALLIFFHPPRNQEATSQPMNTLQKLRSLDLVGCGLFIPSILMVLLALEWGGHQYAWDSATIIGLFTGFGPALMLFVFWELRMGDSAMIPFQLLKGRTISLSIIFNFLFIGSAVVPAFYLPEWFQIVKEASPLRSGIMLLPSITTQILGAISSGFLGFQVLQGLGCGFTSQMPLLTVQNILRDKPKQISIGISLVMFAQYFGSAVMQSLSSVIFRHMLSQQLRDQAHLSPDQVVLLLDAGTLKARETTMTMFPDRINLVMSSYNEAIYLAVSPTTTTSSPHGVNIVLHMMNSADINERPLKKRRFFVDDETTEHPPTSSSSATFPDASPSHLSQPTDEHDRDPRLIQSQEFQIASSTAVSVNGSPRKEEAAGQQTRQEAQCPNYTVSQSSTISDPEHLGAQDTAEELVHQGSADGFDTEAFISIVGEHLSPEELRKIRSAAGDDLERAVNVYFDGSWKLSVVSASNQTTLTSQRTLSTRPTPSNGTPPASEHTSSVGSSLRHRQPSTRYIGAFGVGAWATRSGMNLLRHGEHVNIERARSQPVSKRGRGGRLITNHKGDVLTRFTNRSGQELGRLPRETAEWVSTLIDQKICKFQGVCVFAPDRVRVNDTIYLQLWCYLRIEAFQPSVLNGLMDDNRSTELFEEKENTEEKRLRLRQVALVRLFDEIGLQSNTTNDEIRKQKKEGLLRAAEMQENDKATKDSTGNDSSEEEETPELENDQLDTLYKKAQSFDFSMPEAEPPSSFKLTLRKYQRQALYWMLAKEKNNDSAREKSMHPLWEEYTFPSKDVDGKALPAVAGTDHFYVNSYAGELSLDFPAQEQQCLGGVLADEMGLGKTIEMLSLIHSHRNVPQRQCTDGMSSVSDLVRLPSASAGVTPAPYTTLVVAPTSLLSQWESEAIKASESGTMNVLVYYGNDKSVNLNQLCSVNNPAAPNVIVTTYGVVLSECRQHLTQSSFSGNSTGSLFSVEFFRIILDEAHLIKNRRSKTARACYELKATHRWVLTGTPIVNRLEDLFSLVRFLKVEPWSNFSFWKTFITVPFESKDYVRALNVVQSVLEPLVLRRTKTMKTPEGEPLVPLPRRTVTIEEVELTGEEREIYDYIFTRAKRAFNDNVEAGTLLKSYTTIFAQLLRLRQTCCHPILTRNKAIVAGEEDAATAAETNGLKDDMDLQDLIDRFTSTTESAVSGEGQDPGAKFTTYALKQIQNESSGECPICSEEPMINPAVTACWHSACKKCLEDYIRHQTDRGKPPRCFSCRAPISSKDIFEVIRHQSPNATPVENDISGSGSSSAPPASTQSAPRISLRRVHPLSPSAHTSAKIHALVSHLYRVPSGTKSVVFSQFTSFLDLISPQLTREGITHVRLDGTMSHKARTEVLAKFNQVETFDQEEIEDEERMDVPRKNPSKPSRAHSEPSPQVLLISLRAGGVGLNLTTASNVFMMDPWWSFAIEAQAIDRVHRMGQLRDVNVIRFIVKDSIEGRMLHVQERKMNIAGSLGLIGGDGMEDEKRKERIEELKLLFE